jgi:hypothetical protein
MGDGRTLVLDGVKSVLEVDRTLLPAGLRDAVYRPPVAVGRMPPRG